MRRAVMILAVVLAWGSTWGSAMHSAHAQTMDLMGGSGEAPLAIDAQGGIEWRQDEKLFIAAGPATATRGDLVVYGDELRAYYRDGVEGKSEVYRLDAMGNVRITSPGRIATGGHAVYDVDKSVIVLKDGAPVTLTSGLDVITAEQQLEFWDNRQLAVARGNAVAVRADRRVRADVLTATFKPNAEGKSEIDVIEAFDNVRIDTALDRVYSDRAAYNVPTGLARLTGSVKIIRGDNEINGCSADIDLNTGVSRLNSCDGTSVKGQTGSPGTKPAGPNGRVHGVLAPKGRQ